MEACIAKNIQTHDLCYCMEETAIQRGAKMPQRMPEQVFLEDSFEDMSRKSAELIAEVVRRKPDALVSLPAGSTAKRTYEILHEMAERHEVDFTRTEFVALDEWLDLEDESENCDAFMRKNFYGPLNIPDEVRPDTFVAGAAEKDGQLVTNGGRVLGVTAVAPTLEQAIEEAYRKTEKISFEGAFCRHDIGQCALRAWKE